MRLLVIPSEGEGSAVRSLFTLIESNALTRFAFFKVAFLFLVKRLAFPNQFLYNPAAFLNLCLIKS
jgi:hypothetical protein